MPSFEKRNLAFFLFFLLVNVGERLLKLFLSSILKLCASFCYPLSKTGLNLRKNLNFDSLLTVGQVVIPIGIWVV